MFRLGIDTGGTFTDFVLVDAQGRLRVHKVLSTPDAPERAILEGIAQLGLDVDSLQLVHGSTVATNAVLEGKGVPTLYICNRGFADLLTIGRQQRAELYNLQPAPMPPPVAPECCVEVGGRLDAHGTLLDPLTDEDLGAVRDAVQRLAPEAVAVNLLFSYLDPSLEAGVATAIPGGAFVSLSSQVLPEIREYERGIATWLNAWVGPKVARYLERLQHGLPGVPVAVMLSSGDTVAAAQAANHAVRLLLSGPAGGLIAAAHVGRAAGIGPLLTFDMGGTSTDVALVDGDPRLTSDGRIGPYPVAVPMVDMHTIGAGGGSIAWLDPGGMLQVGPQSAGADPGPACYGRGGRLPTVTDANLLLGRLQPDAFLGGEMPLDVAAATRALDGLALGMHTTAVEAARGIVAVANEHMAQALRAISIRRGADPSHHVLVSFGGAGGLHVCALANLLDMRTAMVPVHGGVLSALGMLAARPGRQLSRTWVAPLSAVDDADIDTALARLADEGLAALQAEGHDAGACEVHRSLDLRYRGQSYTLNVPWQGVGGSAAAFHDRHALRYGHRMHMAVELVNLRAQVRGPSPDLRLAGVAGGEPAGPCGMVRLAGIDAGVPLYLRERLVAGQHIDGPALIAERVATTWLEPGWALNVDTIGNLMLQRV